MIKKTFKILMTICIFSLSIHCICLWWDLWVEPNDVKWPREETYIQPDSDNTKIGDKVDIKSDNSIMIRLLQVFWLDTNAFDWDHKFLNYVRAILNMALWLLSMAALIMIIYTFYLMFFTDNDAWIKKAKWNLVGIFIALVIIWIAWLIVSFIFRWYQDNWKKNEDKISGNTTMNYELNDNNQIYLTI